MSNKNNVPSLVEVLKRIVSVSENCNTITNNLNAVLTDIQYLAISLSFLAENYGDSPELVSKLREDVKFASSLQQNELQDLTTKILGYLDDFIEFASDNEELKAILKKRG